MQTHNFLRNITRRAKFKTIVIYAVIATVMLITGIGLGAIVGIRQGKMTLERNQVLSDIQVLFEQYTLGLDNVERGEFDLARQRFEYILSIHPDFPGASDQLLQVLTVIYATATPSQIPPTPTQTKEIKDDRPAEELFIIAQDYFNLGDWYNTIDTIIRLRNENPDFQVVEVDGLLFTSLRNLGIQKISSDNNLAGGMYDLALAERFGPLDVETNNWRNLARLYLFGLSFWEVIPESAVYYFSQVAGAAPYLRDGSGWTARERYRIALLHYADLLARQGEWCDAQRQYDTSLSIGEDNSIQATAQYAMIMCSPPTATPTATSSLTGTPTITGTLIPTYIYTETQTQTVIMSTTSPTSTPTLTTTIDVTAIPSGTVTPSPTDIPTSTPTQSPQPTPSPTPSPSATLSTSENGSTY